MERRDTKEYLEGKYAIADPWGYRTNPHDRRRRHRILSAIKGSYKRALDLGAGEGWITQHLPAQDIHGFEISDLAASRFPENVQRVMQPDGYYDLILATGVFYYHYDWRQLHGIVYAHACGAVVTSHIKDYEIPLDGKQQHVEEFSYEDKTQILRVYDFSFAQYRNRIDE